ncbi:hypothetical protein MMC13_000887 [Lambiella insularis]|nr:hypothetical protein [Lambiella insularis]
MFSYLQGIRPGTRRTASTQAPYSHRSESGKEIHEGPVHVTQRPFGSTTQGNFVVDSFGARPSSSGAPTLPPIPRVASHYGLLEDSATRSPELVVRAGIGENDSRQTLNRGGSSSSTRQQIAQHVERRPPQSISESGQRLGQISPPHRLGTISTGTRHTEARPARSHTEIVFDQSSSSGFNDVGNSLYQPIHTPIAPATRTQIQLSANANVPQARHGRPRLNLLNPMSILARRRSAQADTQAADRAYTGARDNSALVSRLPDNYDPRIRGKVVHDFSAPRSTPYNNVREKGWAERRVGIEDAGSDDAAKRQLIEAVLQPVIVSQASLGENIQNTERQHTPVFKEQFDDELEPWRFDSNDRRNQHTTGLLDRLSDQELQNQRPSLPPFARNFPSDFTRNLHMEDASFLIPKKTPPPPIPELSQLETSPANVTANVSSIITPPKTRSRAASITDPTLQSANLPKHLRSNASRFSFDFAAVGSAAQEKLLEERHRQKNANRKRGSATSRASADTSSENGFEEDVRFEEDGLDYDDELEERIPGVNADADDELVDNKSDHDDAFEESIPGVNVDKDDESDDDPNPASHPLNFSLPRNISRASQSGEEALLRRCTEDLHKQSSVFGISHTRSRSTRSQPNPQNTPGRRNTRDINGHSNGVTLPGYAAQTPPDQMDAEPPGKAYEDDLYFDDGLIDQLDEWEGGTFDESVFDDERSRVYGLPLRDLLPLPNVPESSSAETSQRSTRPISAESGNNAYHTHGTTNLELDRQSMAPPAHIPIRKKSLAQTALSDSNFDQSAGLTQNNLAAYHSALALAADRAARDGRFDRKPSVGVGEQGQSLRDSQRLRVSFNEDRTSQELDESQTSGPDDDTKAFNFDDEQDDDAIIAAANAEALENDDEGFYGREFGFFAHASGSGEAQYSNGGYFGPAGSDALKRSHSGKANFQEPSLTPITERSEWSQRNSMISLAMQGVYSPTMPNPGLAQLADAMQYEDDNMSLSALLKLRRGAFGGSNGSLRSSGSRRSGSPQTYLPPASGAMFPSNLNGTNFAGSSYSLVSNSDFGSDAEYASTNPTLTLQTQGLTIAHPGMQADKSSGSDSSPKRRNAVKGPGHSRNSSGAESVSYVKEMDEDGAGRWVLEKRRTAEGGQVEVFGRQIVEGGRI